jgi:hypothetical protein
MTQIRPLEITLHEFVRELALCVCRKSYTYNLIFSKVAMRVSAQQITSKAGIALQILRPSADRAFGSGVIWNGFHLKNFYSSHGARWHTHTCRSRDSVVGIVTGYRLDDRGFGVLVPVGLRIFSSPCRPDRLWDPPNLLSNGYRGALSPGVKRPRREADYSHPASVEVKKMWIYKPTPPYASMA